MRLFADDVKIWRTIESSTDVQRLQNYINQLSIWSQGALMSCNTDKCVVLRLVEIPLIRPRNRPLIKGPRKPAYVLCVDGLIKSWKILLECVHLLPF